MCGQGGHGRARRARAARGTGGDAKRGCPSPRTGQPPCPGRERGAAYGCWKPASWRIFCASGVLSQATNATAASLFLDCFSVAAG